MSIHTPHEIPQAEQDFALAQLRDWHYSPKQALAQLRFAHSGLVRMRQTRVELEAALAQVTPEFVDDFLNAHPRAHNMIIYRCRKHEVQLRGLRHGQLSVHWIDNPRLVGQGIGWGLFQAAIEDSRVEAAASRAAA